MLSSITKAYSDYHINSFYEQYKGDCCKRVALSKPVHNENKNSPGVTGQYSEKHSHYFLREVYISKPSSHICKNIDPGLRYKMLALDMFFNIATGMASG